MFGNKLWIKFALILTNIFVSETYYYICASKRAAITDIATLIIVFKFNALNILLRVFL